MARRCIITGRGVMVGNTVSHSNRKVRRRFLPNIQNIKIWSAVMGKTKLPNISTRGIRTIEHNGGLDRYLMDTPNSKLTSETLALKKHLYKMMNVTK